MHFVPSALTREMVAGPGTMQRGQAGIEILAEFLLSSCTPTSAGEKGMPFFLMPLPRGGAFL